MSGYTPVFQTVFEGSLFGRYPDTAAWMFFLALADWKGEVDKTPEYIASVTGMPLQELLGCIERFMQPDPRSRSQAEEGRKLVLIDTQRDWGWKVVNIGIYRKKASGQNQISDGRNAAKVKRYRDRHRATPSDTARHRATPPDTDSYSNTDSYTDKSVGAPLNSSPRHYVSSSSLALKEQDDLKSRSEEERQSALANSVQALAQSKRVPR